MALGTVIRGETYHFEIVSNESRPRDHGPGRRQAAGIGNGILTVEDEEQAWARARVSEGDKGGGAARAALTMVALKQQLLGRQAMSAAPKQARSVARLAAVQALYQMEVSSVGVETRDPRVHRAPLRPRPRSESGRT